MTYQSLPIRRDSVPLWLSDSAARLSAARGEPRRLRRVVDHSPVPMVLVDEERRYVHANTPARLAFRLSMDQLSSLRIDDLQRPACLPRVTAGWASLLRAGSLVGAGELPSADGAPLEISYFALAHVLPGLHLVAFVPSEWPDREFLDDSEQTEAEAAERLSPRELQVLELAAQGCTGPMIARELVLSAATVRKHFENIYDKLDVRDRAAAVAKAIRLGLIA